MMIKKKTSLAALSLLLLTAQLYASTANAAKPDLVSVSIKKNLYTGFVADRQGHIIAHLGDSGSELGVKNSTGDSGSELHVKDSTGATYRARIVYSDADSGLSLLKITTDTTKLKPYLFAHKSTQTKRKVLGIFVPDDRNLTRTNTIDVPTTVQMFDANARTPDSKSRPGHYYLHNAKIGGGGLGGPLFNNCCEAIGVNIPPPSFMDDENSASYAAVPVKWLQDKFSTHGLHPQYAEQCPPHAETCTPKLVLTPGQKIMIWSLAAGGALLLLLLLVWIPKRRAAARKHRERAAAQSHAAEAQAKLAAHDKEDVRIHATPSVFLEGQDKDGQSVALRIPGASIAAEGGVVVGRSSTESNFTINHPEVSRKQLRLFSDGSLLKIADLGSTNGTHVDGKHLGANEEAVLADRSHVAISHLQLSARLQHANRSSAPSASID